MKTELNMSVAVIIPAYNVENYIADALDSVAAQDPAFDEVIIIDDGSTDSTAEIIERFRERLHALVLTTENRGLGPARNLGIERANSEYLYFLDSDDILDPEFTKIITNKILEDDRPELLLFNGLQFNDGGDANDHLPAFERNCEGNGLSGSDAIKKLTRTGGLFPVAVLYVSKRDLWIGSGIRFKPIVHEDEELILPLMLAAQRVTILRNSLYHRRARSGSITSSRKTKSHCDGLLEVTHSVTKLYAAQTEAVGNIRGEIRRKAIRVACRYMRTCKKANVSANLAMMMRYALVLRSLDIVLGAIGSVIFNVSLVISRRATGG